MKLRPPSESTPTDSGLPRSAGALLEMVEQLQKQNQLLQGTLNEKAEIIDKKSDVIDVQKKRIAVLMEYLRLANHKQYAPSSEKNVLQGELFNEAELLADGDSDSDVSGELEPEADTTDEAKPKKRKKRQRLSVDLPREQVLHLLTEEEKEGAIDTFFVTVKEELDIVPAIARVLEHLQEKAVFLDDHGKRTIVAAQRPAHPLGKAIASYSLLTYLIIGKYADGLPLYRLEGILKRYGGEITRTTMANWLIRLSVQLQPIVNLLEETLLSGNYIQGDETRMKVLK